MKVASILLAAALVPAAAGASQTTPSSITLTSTIYCADGHCHAPQYEMLQHVALATRDHKTLDGLKVSGSIADDNAIHTLTIDGEIPHPPTPPGGPGGPMEPPRGPTEPPHMFVHAEATYRGLTLVRASGAMRDENGRVRERWTITT